MPEPKPVFWRTEYELTYTVLQSGGPMMGQLMPFTYTYYSVKELAEGVREAKELYANFDEAKDEWPENPMSKITVRSHDVYATPWVKRREV